MRKFHIKNILLGIGIGVVLTALTGIIYSAGMEPQMSKEEIMARARQYGMVSSSEMIKEDEQKESETANTEGVQAGPAEDSENTEGVDVESTAAPEGTENIMAESTAVPGNIEGAGATAASGNTENIQAESTAALENTVKKQVQVAIAPGDNPYVISKKLVEKGLIDDADSFVNEIRAMNLQRFIQVGEYTIEEGTDIKTIIRIICKRKKI
ncbi:aminodeoxychorismate lyase [Acetivibrio straminisolvens]|jgi:hypothetical protein|uniref:Uncharacterized protein n=1 Tax=Acetivibrio straminisolvens JCM 21531 TaxID=1294263 RepID=W4V6H8_9FIRM|nr:aminodeoxychorismate lyase [Acetivibrio straminisolvens]GAE89005.1 hypothetical protein JCM21531_2495 [Acetivibrio straminisolvens JCM 21531]